MSFNFKKYYDTLDRNKNAAFVIFIIQTLQSYIYFLLLIFSLYNFLPTVSKMYIGGK